MSSVFMKSAELLAHFDTAGMTPRSLVQAVLRCAPVDAKGHSTQWPTAAHLTVQQVMDTEVWSTEWKRSVPGHLVMASLVADHVIRACLYATQRTDCSVTITVEQRDEILDSIALFMRGLEDESVQGLLHHQPAADGFYSSFVESDPDQLEVLFASDGDKPRRLLDEAFMGARLVIWRTTRSPAAGAGERLYDTVALLLDERGRQAAYAQMRFAVLPPVQESRDWVSMLDAYDALGLELGLALQQAHAGRLLTGVGEPVSGLAVLQLQEMEVRADIRGQGLGMRMLERALPFAVKRLKHQPQVFAMAAKPMQYDYPLAGMPADMLLDALDAAEAMAKYFQNAAPHESIASLMDTDILFLGVDERAMGSVYQQLDALADACPENEDV